MPTRRAAATFGAVFLKIGVSNCDMGTSYFLPRLVGASRSAELLLTARIFDAEAEAIGRCRRSTTTPWHARSRRRS